ncbi:MAG TPA: hypothetical protein VFX70_08730 [Mycobacteriales bacterium]|nr:hypothetical protein [Mycobacteriales bacterium]
MAAQEPPGERVFTHAQSVITALFDAWAAGRGRQVELATVRQALRFKWENTDGNLHHWSVEDFPRLFGDWLPYRGTVDRRTLASLGPTMLSFVDFLGDVGWLEPTVRGWWDLRAMVTGLAVWLVDALTECGQCGVMADRLYARKANIGDPTVQERLLTVMARHLVEHFPPPPVEPSLLSWMDPERVAFRTTRWMQPPVRRPSPWVLSRAAAVAPGVRRLTELTRWAARPRRLTVRGNLGVADAVELAGRLDVGPADLARFSGRRVSSSALLTETHLAFTWAVAARLVAVRGRRLATTVLGVALIEHPAELAYRATSALCAPSMPSMPSTSRAQSGTDPTPGARDEASPDPLRILLEALYCASRPLDFTAFTDQIGGLPGPPGELTPGLRAGRDDLRGRVRQLEDLGVLRCTGGALVRPAGGPTRRVGGQLSLTPLGTWCVNRMLRAEGLPTPFFGELVDCDAVTLLEMCAGYDDAAAAEEARLWAGSRGEAAAAELAEAIRTAHPSTRMSAFAALSGIGRCAETAVRGLLDEPRIRPFALIWLIDHGLENHHAMGEEDIAHMLVEAMVPYLNDDPARAVYMFTRGRTADDQIADIAHVWRLDNPYAVPLLEAIAARHPNDDVAHAARVALRTR